jgi:hypothetical protein
MATVSKDFKVKNGLIVEGTTATVNNYDVLTKKPDDQTYIIGLIGGSATPDATPDTVVLRDENADFSANMITSDLTGDVTGTVSSIANHNTDELDEGLGHLYFTNQRALDATSAAYDAAGSAADALSDANSYTDSALESYTTTANLDTTIDGYGYLKSADLSGYATETYADNAAGAAEDNANTYTDNKIDDASNATDKVWSAYKTSTEIGLAQSAAEDYADTAIANLVDSAPATLDTLNELAAALQDNPDIISDLQDVAAGKQDTLTTGNGIVIDNNLIYIPTSIGSGVSITPSTVEIDRAVVDTWYDASGAASSAQSAAEDYADGLAVNYDAAGSASAAQSAAQSYADGLDSATNTRIDNLTTDDVEEGNNMYFTDSRATNAAGTLLATSSQTNISISYDSNTQSLTVSAENGIADSTTDDLEEGTSNLYFTDQRAIDALENTNPTFTTVSIDSVAKQVAATTEVATASTITAFSWAKADFRTAKFLVKTAYGTHTDVAEVLLTLDTSDNIAITEYAMVGTNGSAMTISADVDGVSNLVRLRVATVNNNSTVNVVGTLLA